MAKDLGVVKISRFYRFAAILNPLLLVSCRENATTASGNSERYSASASELVETKVRANPDGKETSPDSQRPWRTHSLLAGRFLPEYPDDLQVIVHDGGPRLTKTAPELIWVRVVEVRGETFKGTVLNAPHQLVKVRLGEQIGFQMKNDWEHPVQVRENYLKERGDWVIEQCDKCGFDELFDAPSELIRAIFPNLPEGAVPETFTSFCPLCGGVQLVRGKDVPMEE